MKNSKLQSLKKGFTLIELLVVVLIIGILASVALPSYQKAVERSRIGGAVTLMNSIVQAQQRKYMQTNRYAASFSGLDLGLSGAVDGEYSSDETGVRFVYVLRGTPFYPVPALEVTRMGKNDSTMYQLVRYYNSELVTCKPWNPRDSFQRAICADFCGIENPDTLSQGGRSTPCCSNGEVGQCPTPSF